MPTLLDALLQEDIQISQEQNQSLEMCRYYP